MAIVLKNKSPYDYLTLDELLDTLEFALKEYGKRNIRNITRRRIALENGIVVGILPAGGLPIESYGVEIIGHHGLQERVGYDRETLVVYDALKVELAGILYGCRVNAVRTGLVGALGVKYLARDNARVVGVIGTGGVQHHHLLGTCRVREIREVRVFSPTQENREAFCNNIRPELPHVTVHSVSAAQGATEGCDILLISTSSITPVTDADWIAPGAHISSIASGDLFDIRDELGLKIISKCDRVIVSSKDRLLVDEADIYRISKHTDAVRWEDIQELADVMIGRVPGRQNNGEITLCRPQGMGFYDLAVGIKMIRKAIERREGTPI